MSEDPWTIDERTFPIDQTERARLEFLVRYAILAPSSHNSQPWLFQIRNEALELFADPRRKLPVVDPDGRELIISCGAALALAECAARHFGYAPRVSLLPEARNPDMLARLRLDGHYEPSEDDAARFRAIPRRRTTRLPFEQRTPPSADILSLSGLARHRGVTLRLVTETTERSAIADLIAEADNIQMDDRRFRDELADWMHSSRARTRDGMSDASMGMPDALSKASALVIRTFDLGGGLAARNRQLAAGSPVIGILATADDSPLDWLNTGLALGDILLQATAAGMCTAYLNQPVEVPALRLRLRDFGVPGFSQIILRLGYGPEVPHAQRRELRHVICG